MSDLSFGFVAAFVVLRLRYAPVAQLDRAAASEAVGQKFESSRAHHSPASKEAAVVSDNPTSQAHRDFLLGAGDTPTKRKPAWSVLVD